MGDYYGLVDAVAGAEATVADALRKVPGVTGVTACKHRSHDFLVRFRADAFDKVDDFLQTHVNAVPGVAGVEVVTDWDDYGTVVKNARDALG